MPAAVEVWREVERCQVCQSERERERERESERGEKRVEGDKT